MATSSGSAIPISVMASHDLEIANLHCSSCEADVRQTIKKLCPEARAEFSADRRFVRILADSSSALDVEKLIEKLEHRGFNVTSVEGVPYSHRSRRTKRKESFLRRTAAAVAGRLGRDPRPRLDSNESQVEHLAICAECRSAFQGEGERSESPQKKQLFRAVYSIGGMTCSSCAQSVARAVRENVPNVVDVSVDVVSGAAWIILPSKLLAPQVTTAIEDAGFEPLLTEMLPMPDAEEAGNVTIRASIGGMTCGACANNVRSAVLALPFVSVANIDPVTGAAEITVTGNTDLRTKQLKNTVEETGYGFTLQSVNFAAPTRSKARTIKLLIEGIFCEECPRRVMKTLERYGSALEVIEPPTLRSHFVLLTYVPSPPSFTIRSILRDLGKGAPRLRFSIALPKSLEQLAAENLENERRGILWRLMLVAILSIPAAAMMLMAGDMGSSSRDHTLMLILATPAYLFCDDIFHRRAIKELSGLLRGGEASWSRRLLHFGSMNLLMSLGTSISYWASVWLMSQDEPESYFDSVIFLTLFLLTGRYLDVYSKAQTSSAVSSITNLRPDTVDLFFDGGKTERIPVDEVEVGDTVAVLPGNKCAVDGVVSQNSTDMDESMLTGEALPVAKTRGDQVFAGSLNSGQQRIVVKVGAVSQGTLLGDIVESVRAGQLKSAPIERYVEAITGVFVPVVVYVALLVWLVWYAAGKRGLIEDPKVRNWGTWSMEFAIATFVVACPCGIGLAAPTALYIGSGLAAKFGILARGGGEAFQEAAGLTAMCFDKTGTLTQGTGFHVTDVWPSTGAEDYLRLAAVLEMESVHPLASAIIAYAPSDYGLISPQADITQVSGAGRGVRAILNGGQFSHKTAMVGNERLLTDAGVSIPADVESMISGWKSEGKSVIVMSVESTIVLALAAADKLRPEAPEVVHALQSKYNIQCYMISGDNKQTARAVAAQVGIPAENVLAEVLPEEKANRVRYLQQTAGLKSGTSNYSRAIVAMVGDGVNDAPALATSDVGIALGRGADIALSSSQFVLVREDLRSVLVLVKLSRAVINRVKFNFFWAGIYNILALPIAAGILWPWIHRRLDPVFASLAMALSSVSVVVSSLLLRRFKP